MNYCIYIYFNPGTGEQPNEFYQILSDFFNPLTSDSPGNKQLLNYIRKVTIKFNSNILKTSHLVIHFRQKSLLQTDIQVFMKVLTHKLTQVVTTIITLIPRSLLSITAVVPRDLQKHVEYPQRHGMPTF